MSKSRSQASNNARSNSMNPNNAAYHASVANRANQLNPDHAAHPDPAPSTPASDKDTKG